jgi:hypothetical protein
MPPSTHLTAAFESESDARAALEALVVAGIKREQISLRTTTPNTEAPFLTRLVITIVLWSLAGGVIGAALGALLWLLLGPSGTGGLIIQIVSWIIFGHLIGGLWAGYVLLADRTNADLPHERQAETVLTIESTSQALAESASVIVSEAGGRTTEFTG